jgi:hypothetical protein
MEHYGRQSGPAAQPRHHGAHHLHDPSVVSCSSCRDRGPAAGLSPAINFVSGLIWFNSFSDLDFALLLEEPGRC